MFNISEATERDIPTIQEIASRTWWVTYSTFVAPDQIDYMLRTIYAAETIKNDMATGAQTFLLLTNDSRAKAFAAFGKRPEDRTISKLYKLYVLPSAQEKGYGRALIEHVKNRLLKENIHTLDVNVNRHNPARFFYEKYGFKFLREEDIPIGTYWMNDFVLRMEF